MRLIYLLEKKVLAEAGELDRAERELRQACTLLTRHAHPTSLSVVHALIASVLLERSEHTTVRMHIDLAADWAERDEYLRGKAFARLLDGELRAWSGEPGEARRLTSGALEAFAALDICEGRNFEIAARTLRLVGDLSEAESLVKRALSTATVFPMARAALYKEQALIRLAAADRDGATSLFIRARRLYQRCGCPVRAEQLRMPTAL